MRTPEERASKVRRMAESWTLKDLTDGMWGLYLEGAIADEIRDALRCLADAAVSRVASGRQVVTDDDGYPD